MGLTERFLSPLPLADAAVTVAAPNRFGIKAAAPPLPLSLLLPPLPPLPMLALPLERWPGADAFKEGRMFEDGYFFLASRPRRTAAAVATTAKAAAIAAKAAATASRREGLCAAVPCRGVGVRV